MLIDIGGVRVGMSGYTYFWNKGKPTLFKRYCNQGFPTGEVNASFYRSPMSSWIKAQKKCPQGFDFNIKPRQRDCAKGINTL